MTDPIDLPIRHPLGKSSKDKKRLLQDGDHVVVPRRGTFSESVHVFDQDSIDALNCALAADRPLLVRGEPGTGKSQLAYAIAEILGWSCRAKVVDARTESRDLLYEFDVVERLGMAQTLGAAKRDLEEVRRELAPAHFLRPGVLWWAFEWSTAAVQARRAGEPVPPGCVVLIDEIDKGDADVPNGLLESLGNAEFPVPGREKPVCAGGMPLLVIITTNEEKTLPAPFQRRCVVLHLDLPKSEDALIETLCGRAAHHFPTSAGEVRLAAAKTLLKHRKEAKDSGLPSPGQAEYLDLVRAVTRHGERGRLSEKKQVELVETFGGFTYDKNPRRDLE